MSASAKAFVLCVAKLDMRRSGAPINRCVRMCERRRMKANLEKCLACGAVNEHSTRDCPLGTSCFRCGGVGHRSKVCVCVCVWTHACRTALYLELEDEVGRVNDVEARHILKQHAIHGGGFMRTIRQKSMHMPVLRSIGTNFGGRSASTRGKRSSRNPNLAGPHPW